MILPYGFVANKINCIAVYGRLSDSITHLAVIFFNFTDLVARQYKSRGGSVNSTSIK